MYFFFKVSKFANANILFKQITWDTRRHHCPRLRLPVLQKQLVLFKTQVYYDSFQGIRIHLLLCPKNFV